MVNINKKLLIYSIFLLSIVVLGGIKVSERINYPSNNNIPSSNENESINLKLAATEEWIIMSNLECTYEHVSDIGIDSNGNIYLLGSYDIGSPGPLLNSTIIKYNSSGAYQWNVTHNASKRWQFESYGSIFIDNSDNIYVSGTMYNKTSSDTLVVKYDTNGNEIWNRTWGSSNGEDVATDVAANKNGDVYICGFTDSYESKGANCLLIKYNSTGNKEWNRTWSYSKDTDLAYTLCIDSQGNIFMGGYGNQTLMPWPNNYDVFLTYWNGSNGDLLWNTTWGSIKYEICDNMAIDAHDCVYIIGESTAFSTSTEYSDFFVVKYDNTGLAIWSKIWGNDYDDRATSIAIDSGDNIYFLGDTIGYGTGLYDLYITKFNSDGVQQWYTLWGRGDNDFSESILIDQSTNDTYIAGNSNSFSVNDDMDWFLLKNPSLPTIGNSLPISGNPIYNYINNIIEDENDNSDDENVEAIPGYNLLIVLGVIIGVISIVVIKKYYKN